MIPQQVRRQTFPNDIWEGLQQYVDGEKDRIESVEVRNLLTPEIMAWEILKSHMQKMGYYPPKKKEVEVQ